MILRRPSSPSFCSFSSVGTTTVSNCRMIDAVMYGMMPSAKTVSRRMLPPANRSKKPKIDPGLRAEELLPALEVDARRGDVAAQTIHRQQPQREQEPLAEVGDAKHVRERFKKLVHGSLRFPALFARSADHLRRAAGLSGFSPEPIWKNGGPPP